MQERDDRPEDRRDRFKALYEQHYPDVLRYAARRIGAEAARDVAAETFTVAWRRLDAVPAPQPLPWLYATARRCLANELRSQDRRDRLDARMRAEASTDTGAAHPEFAATLADRLDVLAALATLRPNDQEALRLTEWEQLDDATAAQVAGCSITAFKVRLHRARRRLARAFDQAAKAMVTGGTSASAQSAVTSATETTPTIETGINT
jgi:RNA polymerase sigma-70 factor (ECF subfamily)